MSDASTLRGANENRLTAAAAVASGEVWQLPNGRAAVFSGLVAAAAGDRTNFVDVDQVTVTKKAGQVWIDGGPIWWDHSANEATALEPIGAGDRDFFLGCAVGDAASADVLGAVNLNVKPEYIIDSARDNGDTVIVKTVVGSTTVEVPNLIQRGGMLVANFGTTAEAQKVDWLSDRSFAIASNFVAEILIELATAADAAAADINVGVASGTHATDFEAVAEFAAFQMNGANLNINAHSDDGTSDVAITDTTIDWAAGTPVRLWLDGRDPTNVKYYVEGSEVLAATANLGKLTAATGPLFAIFHMEKTSDDSPGVVKVRIRVRTMQQDSLGN